MGFNECGDVLNFAFANVCGGVGFLTFLQDFIAGDRTGG